MRSLHVALLAALTAAPTVLAQPLAAPPAELPALSREWHGADYKVAFDAISQGAVPLPRLSTKDGAALLRRLTSTENLKFNLDKKLPVEPRLQDLMVVLQFTNGLLPIYLKSATAADSLHSELATVLAFTLRLAATGNKLLDEFIPQIPKDNRYEARMKGLDQVKYGLTQMLVGAEVTLNERSYYTADDLSLITSAMAESLPSMKTMLADDFRAELRRKLVEHRKAATRPADIRNFDRMLAELAPR